MNASDWGADGRKNLTAKVDGSGNGGNLSSASLIRSVDVSVNVEHWANGDMIWLDPNILANGEAKNGWTPSFGATTVTTTSNYFLIKQYTNGAKYLSANNDGDQMKIIMPSWFGGRSGGNEHTSFSSFSLSLADQFVYGIGGNRNLSYGWSLNPYANKVIDILRSGNNGARVLSPRNTMAKYKWINHSGIFTKNNPDIYYAQYLNGILSASKSYPQIVIANAAIKTGYIGSSAVNKFSVKKGASIGDFIWFNRALSAAEKQEIDIYVAIKYETVGVEVVSLNNNYNLASSSIKSSLIDQKAIGSPLADTILIAGSDYAHAVGGNDIFVLNDMNFRELDGGLGKDTVKLDASFGPITFDLADYTNSARTNANGWHKLNGIEVIDLSTSSFKQTISVSGVSIKALSDNKTLDIILGSNDVITIHPSLSKSGSTTAGFDSTYTEIVGGKLVTLNIKGGNGH